MYIDVYNIINHKNQKMETEILITCLDKQMWYIYTIDYLEIILIHATKQVSLKKYKKYKKSDTKKTQIM